jgi:hypothetical protein
MALKVRYTARPTPAAHASSQGAGGDRRIQYDDTAGAGLIIRFSIKNSIIRSVLMPL